MNYNKTGLYVLLVGCGISFICFFYVVFFSPPIKLAELTEELGTNIKSEESTPPADEHSLKASSDSPAGLKTENPWVLSPAGLAQGQKAYQMYCASCHGPKGEGDGPAAGALKPPPRNLIIGDWQKGGSSIELYKTLNKGIEGTSMVSFSYLSKEDRWALVHYIRSLTQNKVKDDLKEVEKFAKTAP